MGNYRKMLGSSSLQKQTMHNDSRSRKLRILTFNHHESYLASLAETGHQFDVVVRYKDLDLSWNASSRPVPGNVTTVSYDESVRKKLRAGDYDLVVCHTIKNLVWMFPYFRMRFIFVAHIPLFFHSPFLAFKSLIKKLFYKFFALMHRTRFVAVSEFKRRMWAEDGPVVVLTPQQLKPLLDGEGYGEVVVVCNQLKDRQQELGYDMIEKLSLEFPLTIVGNNPGVPNNVRPRNFEEFQTLLQRKRIYLYTIQYPYGDGYNTAMLEAMKLGLAIVTITNPSSPIEHGVNGLVGRDLHELRQHLSYLLDRPSEVDRLGVAARDTVEEKFSRQRFLSAWNDTFTSFVCRATAPARGFPNA